MKVAIIGATGLVGNTFLTLLHERKFPITKLLLGASEKSVGKSVYSQYGEIAISRIEDIIDEKPDFAFFSAGSEVSKDFAPKFVQKGTIVIDNSSYWRMDKSIPLIVPEVNPNDLTLEHKLIANPNCSTIQMVVALKPLHDKFNIQDIIVSTYQSVTGTGLNAVTQLNNERRNVIGEMAYPYQIDQNLIPHIDSFRENFFTNEEMKMVNETQKILSPNIMVSPTCVRVPVMGGHSESCYIRFEKDASRDEILEALSDAPGVKILDDVSKNDYPMPVIAHNNDWVWVGRIRQDIHRKNAAHLWIVSDNLRKGAATNAIQIAELILQKKSTN
ncbi:MAG: aspartate-semialdehyde dehydrogenase [Chitinophagales bacterium]|jgi:aspartate-semialdehyde dehydrogenase|nr:aspartate-semialdehyde dehydrogenase [Chitinophagales bacterium]